MKVCESTSVWKSELREGFLVVIKLIYWVCTTGGGGRSWSKIMERFSSGCQFWEVCFNWLVKWPLTMKTRHMTLQITYHMTKKWHHHYCHGHNGEPTYCKYNWYQCAKPPASQHLTGWVKFRVLILAILFPKFQSITKFWAQQIIECSCIHF